MASKLCQLTFQTTILVKMNGTFRPPLRVSQGFWGTREHWQNIEGNKGTLANFWEQGNKIRKITVQKLSERVWEHGNIGQFWKGTREQGPPPPGDPHPSHPFNDAKMAGFGLRAPSSLLWGEGD